MTHPETDPAFAEHAGMPSPIPLRVEHADAGLLAEGEIDRPFAVVGSDPACEIALNDPTLPGRLACVQVLDGHLWTVPFDTLCPTLVTHDTPFQIGKFKLSRTDARPPETPTPDPRRAELHAGCPKAWLTMLNGPALGERMTLTRAMTFLGASVACGVRVAAEDADAVHAYLVVTADAVWVVDLRSTTGTWVNEHRVRAARLTDGDELRIGRTRFGCRMDLWGEIDTAPRPADTADLVTLTPVPSGPPALLPPPDANPAAVALFQYVAALQGHMMEQFKQSIDSMLATFQQAQAEHAEAMRKELTRMAELNAELHKLHLQAKSPPPSPAMPLYTPVANPAEDPVERHQWVAERLREIEAERTGIWTRIKGMFVRSTPGV